MGLNGTAAVVGVADYPNERKYAGPRKFFLEQWAELTHMALEDAGLAKSDIDGICCSSIPETSMFAPATIAEYLGLHVNFAETVDLGGASCVSMIWRAAAAIELGLCQAVVCAAPALPMPSNPNPRPFDPTRVFGSTSANWGSPQAEFDVPYGNVAQNAGYALIARRYAAEYGYDERALAKIAADQRTNAQGNPNAVFYGQPIDVEDVLASRMIADPLHILEIVMPCAGGSAVIVASPWVRGRVPSAYFSGRARHNGAYTHPYSGEHQPVPTKPARPTLHRLPGGRPRRRRGALARPRA